MCNCEICGKECKGYTGLGIHVYRAHDIHSKDYFIKYLNNGITPVCYCGKETKFTNLRIGFRKFCSSKCAQNSEVIREKIKETNEERYGCVCALQNEEVKEKTKKTSQEKWGVENPSQTKEAQEKRNNTNERIYGTKCIFQSEKIKTKIRETNLEKRGVEYPLQSEEVKEKQRKTNEERYGCVCSLQNEKVKEKSKQTNLEKIGVVNPLQSIDIRNEIRKTYLKSYTEKAKKYLLKIGFEIVGIYEHSRKKIEIKCNKCNFQFSESIFNLKKRKHKCPVCDPFNRSILEGEISENIQAHLTIKLGKLLYIVRNDRIILNGKEIDIFIPELNLSIEVNGVYWHSSKKAKKRDKLKSQLMIKKGFKHFVIKEEDWNNNKQSILQKLDQLIEMDFETYSENISYFTGF